VWDGLAIIIHMLVVAALSVVGVSLETTTDDEPRGDNRDEVVFIARAPAALNTLDDAALQRLVQNSSLPASWRRTSWALDVTRMELARLDRLAPQQCNSTRDELRALVDASVPILLRPDETTS